LAGLVLGALGVRRVDFVLTTFGELIDGVASRRWHINAPMFITAERARRVRFSVPVWAATDSFIIRSNDVRDFTSYEAIAGDDSIRVAAVAGQVQVETARRAGVPNDRIVEFADQDAAASAVLAGDADASVSTAPGNVAYIARLGIRGWYQWRTAAPASAMACRSARSRSTGRRASWPMRSMGNCGTSWVRPCIWR
jgi:polar amino acid transport system substrate-binding protein